MRERKKNTKKTAVCVYAGQFDTPTGVTSMLRVDKGTRTNTHAGTEAAGERCLRRLLLPPDGLHYRATGCFGPASAALHPRRSRGPAFGLPLRQLLGCLPHTWPPGQKRGNQNVMNRHRRTLKKIHKPKLNFQLISVETFQCSVNCSEKTHFLCS